MTGEKASRKKNGWKIFRGITLGVIAAVVVIVLYKVATRSHADMLTPSWKTVELGMPLVRMETPVELQELNIHVTDDMKSDMESFQAFGSRDDAGIFITVSILQYQPGADPQPETEDGVLAGFANKFGATDIDFKTEVSDKDGMKIRKATGQMLIHKQPHIFNRVSMQSGDTVRNVLVMIPQATPGQDSIITRIMKSIRTY